MKKFIVLIALVLALLTSCQLGVRQLTTGEIQYLQDCMAQPTEFEIKASDYEAAWGRASKFVVKYSDTQLKTNNNNYLDTQEPAGTFTGYWYKVTGVKSDAEKYTIEVICFSNVWGGNWKEENAHILAYYIKNNKLMPEMIDRRGSDVYAGPMRSQYKK